MVAGGQLMKPCTLIVDDEPLIRSSLKKAFINAGHDADIAASLPEAEAALARNRYDLCVVDLKLENASGLDLLRRLKTHHPDTASIVITAHGSVETAVQAMRLGASDFVKKPFELDELLGSAENALRAAALQRRIDYHDGRERSKIDGVVCPSPAMQRLESEIRQVAPQPIPVVLILGETGAGKGLVARRLHFGSMRAQGPFVELNAAAVPETLIESELFGHERGAFSDARERKQGLFEIADGGTLFLDEVGDLTPGAQAKLLTFLESFTFRRVGATAVRSVDVRVLAATNRDLATLMKEGKFRADLYYRLSPLTLRVPALRKRVEDVAPLALHFLLQASQRFHKGFVRLAPATIQLLESWAWPGNVRELKAVIERAALMNEGIVLEPSHLPHELLGAAVAQLPSQVEGEVLPTLDELDLRYMRRVLELHGGNKVRAAAVLGITRQTLAKRLGESE
ncbi:MAG: sigma-54 dependent transcriptional regulator [Polyangia bacterium]